MAHDEFGAHMRDELGITEIANARPLQAAWTSAAAFTVGALLPFAAVTLAPVSVRIVVTALAALGRTRSARRGSAFAGGARWTRAALRVVVWSSLAMTVTWAVGRLVGANIT